MYIDQSHNKGNYMVQLARMGMFALIGIKTSVNPPLAFLSPVCLLGMHILFILLMYLETPQDVY